MLFARHVHFILLIAILLGETIMWEGIQKSRLSEMDYEIAEALMDWPGKAVLKPELGCFWVTDEGEEELFSPTRMLSDAFTALDTLLEDNELTFRISQTRDESMAHNEMWSGGPETVFEIVPWTGESWFKAKQVIASGSSSEPFTNDAIHESMVEAIHEFVARKR